MGNIKTILAISSGCTVVQEAQLSQRDALQGALVLAKSGRLELRDNI